MSRTRLQCDNYVDLDIMLIGHKQVNKAEPLPFGECYRSRQVKSISMTSSRCQRQSSTKCSMSTTNVPCRQDDNISGGSRRQAIICAQGYQWHFAPSLDTGKVALRKGINSRVKIWKSPVRSFAHNLLPINVSC